MTVLTGLDRLAGRGASGSHLVKGRKVALLAHAASVSSDLRHATSVLEHAGAELCVIFGPEHGFAGTAQDMIGVGHSEQSAGPRVVSLYGSTFEELSPSPDAFEGVEVLVIDLQDVGSRYYTYIWTAALCLIEAAKAGVETLVLDRPNPLGGAVVEGAPQRAGYRSFVGLYDVSVRHGMTMCEIITMVADLEGIDSAAYETLQMHGWTREMYFDETGLPWVQPSPNMPTLDTALVYPGGCLLEGTLLSEGRGLTRPFEIFGSPWVDDLQLASLSPTPGASLRPLSFEPTFHKHAKQICRGVQVHIGERQELRSYALYQRLIARLFDQNPEEFQWRTEEYEYVVDRPAIDLLTGGPEYRQAVEAGELEDYLDQDSAGAELFRAKRRNWLLY